LIEKVILLGVPLFDLLGGDLLASTAANDGLSPTVKTRKDTPSPFFVHATDDTVSVVEHSATFSLALKRARIDAEMRIFASDGHGFGVFPAVRTSAGREHVKTG
jgi:hypothetical protein